MPPMCLRCRLFRERHGPNGLEQDELDGAFFVGDRERAISNSEGGVVGVRNAKFATTHEMDNDGRILMKNVSDLVKGHGLVSLLIWPVTMLPDVVTTKQLHRLP